MSRPGTRRRRRSGVTLVELLVVLALMTVLTGAVGYGFVAGLDMQRVHAARQAEQDRTEATELRITRLLQGAKLAANAADTTTYFVGVATTDADDLGCDQLTFTTTAPGVPPVARLSEDDFETQHLARGAVGGVAEVSLSMTPAGDAGDRTGLFERVQRPSDGDPTQGGTEAVLSDEVERIGFQFWDGLQWVTVWDTQAGVRRLPAAVMVSYVPVGAADSDPPRVFVVPLPASDVDEQDPVAGGEAGGA